MTTERDRMAAAAIEALPRVIETATARGETLTPEIAAERARESARKRVEAQNQYAAEHESFERCDTDGFLSQWAHGLNARMALMEAGLIERGGVSEHRGLFVAATGERVRAKSIRTKYRECWMVFGPGGNVAGFVGRVWDQPPGPRTKMARLGLEERMELAPSKVEMLGNDLTNVAPYVVRKDGGFPDDAVPWTGPEIGRVI